MRPVANSFSCMTSTCLWIALLLLPERTRDCMVDRGQPHPRSIGAARGRRGTGVFCLHASLPLHHLWDAIFAVPGSAQSVSDLHRRAAVRPSFGPVLDHAGGATEHAQQ